MREVKCGAPDGELHIHHRPGLIVDERDVPGQDIEDTDSGWPLDGKRYVARPNARADPFP